MRFLIIDTYYQAFLNDVRKKNPGLSKKPYREQLRFLISQSFGTSDFYSYNLSKMGHPTEDIIANDEILQRQWANENRLSVKKSGLFSKIQSLPFVHKFVGKPDWVQDIALAQIKEYKPDVLYMQDLSILSSDVLRKAKKYCKSVVGQIASPMPPKENLKQFDLILTSFPHYVERLRKMGIQSEYFKIGFEPRILSKFGKVKKKYDITFIGSFTPHHQKGTRILEKVGRSMPIQIWGQGINYLSPSSSLRNNYHGSAWGLQMYKILAESKIVINRHINAAEDYANNMRLYESTGMGALLMTDKKKNLKLLFDVGKEIEDYSNNVDLLGKIKYYLTHERERSKIARSGQIRTLREHTYMNRMRELVKILKNYVQ